MKKNEIELKKKICRKPHKKCKPDLRYHESRNQKVKQINEKSEAYRFLADYKPKSLGMRATRSGRVRPNLGLDLGCTQGDLGRAASRAHRGWSVLN